MTISNLGPEMLFLHHCRKHRASIDKPCLVKQSKFIAKSIRYLSIESISVFAVSLVDQKLHTCGGAIMATAISKSSRNLSSLRRKRRKVWLRALQYIMHVMITLMSVFVENNLIMIISGVQQPELSGQLVSAWQGRT